MIVERKASSTQIVRKKKFRRKKRHVRKRPKVKKTKTARLRETYIREQLRMQNDWELVSDPYWFNYIQKWEKVERSKYVDYSSSRFRIVNHRKRKNGFRSRSRQKPVTLLKIPEIALPTRGLPDRDIAATLLPVVTQYLQEHMRTNDIIKIDSSHKLHLKERVIKKLRKHWPENKSAEPDHSDYEPICYDRSVSSSENFKPQLSPNSRKDNSSVGSYESPRGIEEVPRKFGIGVALSRLKNRTETDMKQQATPVKRAPVTKLSKPSVKTDRNSKDLLKGQGDKADDNTKIGKKAKVIEKPDKKPASLLNVKDHKVPLRPPPIEAGVQTSITSDDMEKIMECKCKKVASTPLKKPQEPKKFKWKL